MSIPPNPSQFNDLDAVVGAKWGFPISCPCRRHSFDTLVNDASWADVDGRREMVVTCPKCQLKLLFPTQSRQVNMPLSKEDTHLFELEILAERGTKFYTCSRGHSQLLANQVAWIALGGRTVIAVTCDSCHAIELVETGLIPPP